MNRAVFLDRDNTIIHNDGDLGEPEKVRLIQGAATAIASLCGLGYKVVVVTNQGGVARGLYTEDDVLLVHERIAQLVREGANGARIDRFYYCPYHPDAVVDEYRCDHTSRKPNPGMILEAAQDLNIDLAQSWTIGDQIRDVQAGATAGTRTILLRADADVLRPIEPHEIGGGAATVEPAQNHKKGPPDYIVRNLTEAVRVIAHARRPEAAEHLQYAHVPGKRFDAARIAQLQTARPNAARVEEDAAEGLDTADAEPARRTAGKPFRPWSHMPPEEQPEGGDRSASVRERFRRLRAERQAAKGMAPADTESFEPAAPPARPATERATPPPPPVKTFADPDLDDIADATAEADAEDEVESEEVTPTSVVATPAPSRPPEPREAPAPVAPSEHTLKLILQELRNQRGSQADFSYLSVIAIVLQMIAAVCLLGALWMGRTDADLFHRWMMVGLLLQGATLAALLFGRAGR